MYIKIAISDNYIFWKLSIKGEKDIFNVTKKGERPIFNGGYYNIGYLYGIKKAENIIIY